VEIAFRTFKEVNLAGGTVIEAIPSVGLVSTIAATYMITNLPMDQVCAVDSEDFPALSMVYAFKPKFPVRIYAMPAAKLAIFIAEVPLPPRVHRALGLELLRWAMMHKARQIVCLEGLPVAAEDAERGIGVWGVGSTDSARKTLDQMKIRQLETGIISGVSGVLLNEGRWQSYDVLTLLAEAVPTIPDANAAARLLATVDTLLPEIELDLSPLKEEAKALEGHLKRLREEAKPAISDTSAGMFR